MKPSDFSSANAPSMPRIPLAARTVFKMLSHLQRGALFVQMPGGMVQRFGSETGPQVSLQLKNWKPFSAALKSGDIGFAESFIDGDWTTPDLTALLRVLVQNRTEVEQAIFGSWWGQLAYRIKHWLNRNNRSNSKKNIHAHYDLGNAFYTRWLDPSMNYSSALFGGNLAQSLQEAQWAKVRRVLEQAGVQAGDRVLEIGCGWGALAEMATTGFGAHVTGVTLSTEQLAFAQDRMQRLGVQQQADLRLQDYRDIPDVHFDAICSIEMIEAVGREFWPTYFQTIAQKLKPGGRACVQSIVIDDAYFERYLRSTDFIQQYIFPGGCLPSPSEFRAQARAAGLDVVNELAFGHDYAETLKRWRDAFTLERQAVLAQGFDERFIRIWEFYLCYCEAAFLEDSIDVVQYTLRKPD